MNQHDRDARFDATMRQLHAHAVERVSGPVLLRMQQRTRSKAQPRRMRAAWAFGTASAALLALLVGLQAWQPQAAPGDAAAPLVAEAGSEELGGVLEENPDLYLWLASDDAYALAME